MRTSNKILLSVFVIALLIVLGIYYAIYVQYKKANWTSLKYEQNDEAIEARKFEGVKFITMLGLQNCTIIPADTLEVNIEKSRNGGLHYFKSGDSLLISTDSIIPGGNLSWHPIPQHVNIYVPVSIEKIIARGCNIEMYGTKDSTKAYSQTITLYDSWFNVGHRTDMQGINKNVNPAYEQENWKHLKLEANDNSKVLISYKAHIDELNVSLSMSDLKDQGSDIRKLSFEADKKSEVTLRGDNLVKATLTSK